MIETQEDEIVWLIVRRVVIEMSDLSLLFCVVLLQPEAYATASARCSHNVGDYFWRYFLSVGHWFNWGGSNAALQCRARRLHSTFVTINQVTKQAPRAPVQPRRVGVRCQRNLAPSLPGALRPLPKTTRNLNGQTTAQLTGEHDNLPAMMTFMSDEIR